METIAKNIILKPEQFTALTRAVFGDPLPRDIRLNHIEYTAHATILHFFDYDAGTWVAIQANAYEFVK